MESKVLKCLYEPCIICIEVFIIYIYIYIYIYSWMINISYAIIITKIINIRHKKCHHP